MGTNPLRSHSPVELKSKDITQAAWPERLATCSPELTSYSAMIRESPAAARSVVAGENVTARTALIRPNPISMNGE
jgi:hypothetical protein